MLLPRLEGQAKTGAPLRVGGPADQSPRHLPDQIAPRRKEADVGSAKGDRIAHRLSLAHGNVRPVFAGGFEETQRNRVHRHRQQRPAGMCQLCNRFNLFQLPEEIRVLNQDGRRLVADGRFHSVQQCPPRRRGILATPRHFRQPDIGVAREVGLDHLAVMRMDTPGDDDPVAAGDAHRHQGPLRQGRRAVIQRGVGHLHVGQLADQRLVLIDRLKQPLAHFGLVGGVGGRKLGAGEDMAHRAGDEVVVAPAPQK